MIKKRCSKAFSSPFPRKPPSNNKNNPNGMGGCPRSYSVLKGPGGWSKVSGSTPASPETRTPFDGLLSFVRVGEAFGAVETQGPTTLHR